MKQSHAFAARVSKSIEASLAVKQALLCDKELVALIAKVSEVLIHALKKGNKVFFFWQWRQCRRCPAPGRRSCRTLCL